MASENLIDLSAEQPKTFGCRHNGPTCRNCAVMVASWALQELERAKDEIRVMRTTQVSHVLLQELVDGLVTAERFFGHTMDLTLDGVHVGVLDVTVVRSGQMTPAELLAKYKEHNVTGDELIALLPGSYYMDPPDGGDVSLLVQLRRMAEDAAKYRHWLSEGTCK